MRAILASWLFGRLPSPADHGDLDRVSGRFGIGVAGITAVIFTIQLIRQLIGAHP